MTSRRPSRPFQRGQNQGERIYLQRREAARLVRALHPLLGHFEARERALPGGSVEIIYACNAVS
jgi:hypothetical protein